MPEKFRTSTGFEPVTLQYWCDALTNWAMKPLILGSGHLWVLMSPWQLLCPRYLSRFKCIYTSLARAFKLRELFDATKSKLSPIWRHKHGIDFFDWLESLLNFEESKFKSARKKVKVCKTWNILPRQCCYSSLLSKVNACLISPQCNNSFILIRDIIIRVYNGFFNSYKNHYKKKQRLLSK